MSPDRRPGDTENRLQHLSARLRSAAPPRSRHSGVASRFLNARMSPAQFIALSFVTLITVGTVLLALPISHFDTQVSVLDALFTATSAVCVTGLVVVDTGTAYNGFGQSVIMLLIQLGGLGLLTFGTFLAFATGRRLGYGERLRLQAQVSALDVGDVAALIKSIGLIVFAAEFAGALLLYTSFARVEGPGRGAYYAIFHSISAFNNAGFSLYPDSLTRYVTDPVVNVVIMVLIVVGGLGFIVIVNLRERFRSDGPRVPLALHTRMALSITGFLIVGATVLLLIIEWNNPATIGELSVPGRLIATLFQAVTPRTAGFNTLDYSQMAPASLLLTMLLMFIGGNPGSTAGGVKTVTFFVLAVSIWSVIRGRTAATVFGRRLPISTVVRAGAVAFGAVMAGGAALTILAVFEPDKQFIALLFETVSALGTAGLSMGITADLSSAGKYVIIALMYLGRIGFLTFALALVQRQPGTSVRFLEEEVVIG